MNAFISVGVGAALGAWLRWGLGLVLNPLFSALPLGTLASNLLGGYLMGLCMGILAWRTDLSPEIRLLVTTGFLGGLTTFSTFSAEAVTLFRQELYGWAMAHIALHVAGSLLLTLLGVLTIQHLKG